MAVFIGLMAMLIACGCVGSSLNSNPPDYIKYISTIKDVSGLQIYFILADKDGDMTTSDGKFVFELTQSDYTLFKSDPINVTRSSFEKRSIGTGIFAHDVILYLIGGVPYENMRTAPSFGLRKVKISFTTPDGKTLEAKEIVAF